MSFTTTTFAPVVLGFFGLGTGYLIYGPQELFGFPARNASVDRATGVWGIWLPGFCQFVTGIYLFAALTLFESLKAPALYMAALAFTAYGIHWFAIGWGRYQGNDPAPNGFMSISFTILSVLGMVVFFGVGGWPVGVLFLGLTLIYISDFFASLKIGVRENAGGEGMMGAFMANPGERAWSVPPADGHLVDVPDVRHDAEHHPAHRSSWRLNRSEVDFRAGGSP